VVAGLVVALALASCTKDPPANASDGGLPDGVTADAQPVPSNPPVITAVDPMEAPFGSTVTISGSGFSANPVLVEVTFAGERAAVKTANVEQVVVSVPYRTAGPMELVVTVAGKSSAPFAFKVTPAATPLASDEVPGELLLGLTDQEVTTEAAVVQAIAGAGGTVFRRIGQLALLGARVAVGQEQAFIGALSGQAGVEFVEPLHVGLVDGAAMGESTFPDDPDLGKQWSPGKTGLPIRLGPYPVRVCVLDSGVDFSHPDLVERALTVPGGSIGRDLVDKKHVDGSAVAGNGVDDDGDGTTDRGIAHGTLVAGVIAAVTNNGIGMSGGTDVGLVSLRIANDDGAVYEDHLAEAVVYAADANGAGCAIINASLGFDRPSLAIKRAVDHAKLAKVLLIAATGNQGASVVSNPAGFSHSPFVIAVGATTIVPVGGKLVQTSAETIATFSNKGPEVEVVAPGEYIYATTFPGGGYTPLPWTSGTSFAAPLVSAAAAVIWSWTADGDGSLSKAERVQQTLLGNEADRGNKSWLRLDSATVHPSGRGERDDSFGLGRLDLSGRLLFEASKTVNAVSRTALGAVRLLPNGFGGAGTAPPAPLPEDVLLGAEETRGTEPLAAFDPAFSSDRRAVVYARPQFGIWVRNLIDGSDTQISTHKNGNWPSWSPDGRRVLFAAAGNLMLVDLDPVSYAPAKERVLLNSDKESYSAPTWHPTGKKVAFVRMQAVPYEAPRIATLELDASFKAVGDPVLLKLPTGVDSCTEPSYAPDGASLAYVGARLATFRGPQGPSEVYVYDVYLHRIKDEVSRRLTNDSDFLQGESIPGTGSLHTGWSKGSYSPVWLPDGRRIAYILETFHGNYALEFEVRLIAASSTAGSEAPTTIHKGAIAGEAMGVTYLDRTRRLSVSRF
jgi:Tol biopolymer transport system component